MATNIVDVSDIQGRTEGFGLTGTLTALVDNDSASNTVLKINSIYAANVDAAATPTAAPVTLSFNNGTTDFSLIKDLSVPVDGTLVIITKNESIYLEPGQSLKGQCTDGTNNIELVISYEEIS